MTCIGHRSHDGRGTINQLFVIVTSSSLLLVLLLVLHCFECSCLLMLLMCSSMLMLWLLMMQLQHLSLHEVVSIPDLPNIVRYSLAMSPLLLCITSKERRVNIMKQDDKIRDNTWSNGFQFLKSWYTRSL
jgi:acyl-CoA synthetase (AMP-forming)/AMP-acid ligase II